MSTWVEKIQSDFIITLGDGKQFRPLWLNAERSIEFNVAIFNFPNVPGSLVRRGQPQGTRYKLEIHFEGVDHLDISESFKNSASDIRAWVINHPMYGSLTVHPISLEFDDSRFNTTRILVPVIETIENINPTATIVPVDKIKSDKDASDSSAASNFSVVPIPISAMKVNMKSLYDKGSIVVTDPTLSQEYFNAFNEANTAINNATHDPLAAIQKAQAVINAPSLFTQSVQTRLKLLSSQYNSLLSKVSNVVSNPQKSLFENNAGSLISSAFVAVATPMDGDYKSKSDVLAVNTTIINIYNSYVTTINNISSNNGGNTTSWIPIAAFQLLLNQLLNFTVSNLLIIALSAKQERIIYLEEDSNVILLAHRFYGLLPDDSTIQQFMDNNKIGLSEILQIKKGKKIIYFS